MLLLLLYLILLFVVFNFRKPYTPGHLLLVIYIVSLVCGLVINSHYEFNSVFELFNLAFLILILSLLIVPWNNFSYRLNIVEPDPAILLRWTIILLIVNGIAFAIFTTIFYNTFTSITNYSSFKNNGGSEEFISNLSINHKLHLFAIYAHTTAYFLVPIHLYYLSKKKYFISFLSFIFSLNIILFGLSVFSRTGFIEYMCIYALYLPFFYNKLRKNKLSIIFKLAIIVFALLFVTLFYKITENRFSDLAVENNSMIRNPLIYSILEYGSQWYVNSNKVMANYSFDTLGGELTFPLAQILASKLQLIDASDEPIESKLYAIWDDNYFTFNGLVANLLFDIGYAGTLYFALTYFLVLQMLKPANGRISFITLIMLGVIFVIPSMGIFSSQMRSVVYNGLLLCTILMSAWVFFKKRMSKVIIRDVVKT